MDEEEYQEEEQSDSKINLGSFFERMDSVEKVAGNALSKANANFGIIEKQKALINSLNISIEAIETKVRDIANYIIIEKKITKDEEADRLVEEQDKEQKDQMIERLMGMKGDQGDQGEPGAPAEEGGGNPIMSFLKGLATLGIAAFVTQTLWPMFIPLIGPLLGKLGLGLSTAAGVGLGAVIGGGLSKIPFGVGKKLGPKVDEGIQNKFKEIGEAVQKGAENIGKDGKLEIAGVGGGEGGAEEVESNENLLEGGESLEDTLKDNDLIKGESFSEYRNRTGNEEVDSSGGEVKDEDKNDINFKSEFKEGSYEFESSEKGDTKTISSKFEGTARFDLKTGKAYILGEEVTIEGYNEYINLPDKERFSKDGMMKIVEKYAVNKVEPVTENKDLDLSLNTVEDETGTTGNNDALLLSQVIDTPSSNNGQVVTAPTNTPNTTTTQVKITKIPIPFINSISNQYLSITGDQIPPEFYRQYA